MPNDIKVKAIVLSAMPIGEYDRRLELLTTDFGRISAFARGARKPSSPLVSSTRVFAFGEFSLYQGRESFSINSANITNYFEELTKDFDKNIYGSYFLELARYFTRENLAAEDVLKLLYQSLRALDIKSIDHSLVRAIYEIKMIEVNGIFKNPENENISEAVAYAIDFVAHNPIEKIYTFKFSNTELSHEFEKYAANLIRSITRTEFKSLEILNTIN